MPGNYFDFPGLQIAMPVANIGAQSRKGGIGGGMFARKDIADAAPALQADVPNPAMLLRGCYRMRDNVALFVNIGHLHGQRPVDKQNIAAIDEGYTHRLAKQQGPESGSIDKEVAAKPARLA